jgi:hypothetical protein
MIYQLNKRIQSVFLSTYDESSFIIRKKAYVLMWLLIIMIPVMIGFIFINIYRNDPKELLAMVLIDFVFLLVCIVAFILLKAGKFYISTNLIIYIITLLSIGGYIAKHSTAVQTGFNSFVILMLANIVFTAIFGSHRSLFLISSLFFTANIVEFFLLKSLIDTDLYGYLLSGSLNTLIGMIIITGFCYFNRIITDEALIITQKELDKNVELNLKLVRKVEQTTEVLEDTVEQVKVLSGLLPICSSCKKIRDDKGYWNQIETYIQKHSKAEFSHSICPVCADELYGNEDWYIKMKQKKELEGK